MPLTDTEYRALSRKITLDIIIDTLGNLFLGLGLYLTFSTHPNSGIPAWMTTPEAKALLLATGIINMRFMIARFTRLRLWQEERQRRRQP